MGVVKIRMNTWNRGSQRLTKFKRNVGVREGFIEMCIDSKKLSLKEGSKKWKNWDTSISRKTDSSYINDRKSLYSGLCFENRNDAEKFMKKHKTELREIASKHPLFDSWQIMNVIKRFEPENKVIYGKDIKE